MITAVVVAAGCRKADSGNRRSDTVVASPVSVSGAPANGAGRACGVSGAPALTDSGIGYLQVGSAAKEVKAACAVISDTVEIGAEGMRERVLAVGISGDVVEAIVDGERIQRIEIATPHYRTRDSLGVDTSLHRIARARGAKFLPGEDGVYGFMADHCGLSFRFSIPLRPPTGRDWTVAAIDSAHGDATVDRVLVTKCQR